ncbi:hypothetical protein AC625_04350 [Peribacillus loiseleuriae]|uniref:Uncharacterized protein n=1 Tax=Peribacillus loiseleuriae TaxID=1679170 RepID=A0A0K9GQ61_9BACI|nr:hypothetical protein AC625_04350 [Peribacillus loiseleuriae]
MKILGVTCLMLALLFSFSLYLDILQGFDFRTSLKNAYNPFVVMETPELVVLFLFVFILFADTIIAFVQKKKGKTNKTKT